MQMKKIAILILACFVAPVHADSIHDFESVTIGFKVTKPMQWVFVSAEATLENLKRIKMNDKEFQELMLKYSKAPLVSMTKYKEPFDDINPSFKVNTKPLGQFKGEDPKKIFEVFLPHFQSLFADFELAQAPISTTVAGLDAAYMRVNYSIEVPDGREFATTSEMWIVPRGNYFFMIGAGTREDEKTGSRDEIKSILNTISFDE